MTSNRRCLMILLAALLFTGGCVTPKSMTLDCTSSTDLSGTLCITAHGCHSSHNDENEKKNEMEEFVDKRLKEHKEALTISFSLENATLDTQKNSDGSIDAQLEGSFNNILDIFTPFIHESSDYSFSHDEKIMAIHVKLKQEDPDAPFLFKFRFAGTVLEENAQSKEDDGNVLVWRLNQLPKEGLILKLQTGQAPKQNENTSK